MATNDTSNKETRTSDLLASVNMNSWARAPMWFPGRVPGNPCLLNQRVRCSRDVMPHILNDSFNEFQPTSTAWAAPMWLPWNSTCGASDRTCVNHCNTGVPTATHPTKSASSALITSSCGIPNCKRGLPSSESVVDQRLPQCTCIGNG